MKEFTQIAEELLKELSPKDKQDLKDNLTRNIRESLHQWAFKSETKPLRYKV